MRARSRATDGYVVVAMLAAAAGGRLLDAAALLPGVHEARVIRGGSAAWLTALLIAGMVGAAAAGRWTSTRSVRLTSRVVVPGQAAAFLAAEAVVRVANGQGALDPDGLVGAGLQAAFAVVLLLVLTAVWVVADRCRPLRTDGFSPPADRRPRARRAFAPLLRTRLLLARGPPRTAGT
jgi:hypothetical protein